ncbi:LysR family transcriptional regulator [Phytoactinopolyspora halotolerans]|uniref:LysR family transcriptional regulator n=1 Tax=Phytoactinopolyspora halotolerans TaxID=1981512 RepID=A0A6L9S9D3_9ACTN|nr:LysR family transcriptional regulator [Phytoactinopolyspora halotolerans]NEE01234.1 LysR family transcriptional regulator [Phytoactinopolyspora halotolerans]
MFTLDQVRGFIAVAEEGHFGRAAERLNMTQPPLSRQIQKLEKAVGTVLLERDNRKVELTPAGAAFLAEAKRLVAASERAPDAARRIAAGMAGQLRIGFTATSSFALLGPLLGRITAELPDVDIELHEMVTSQQVEGLQNGDLDLGLARPPFDMNMFDSHPLLAESLDLAVQQGHDLDVRDGGISADMLRNVPLIMYSPTDARYFYDLAVRLVPFEHRNVVHTVNQILTAVALVAAGRGVAFVPRSARLLGIDGVSYVPIDGLADNVVEIHAVWIRDARNPALARVVHMIRT